MHVVDVLKYHTVAISHVFDLTKHNKYRSAREIKHGLRATELM